MNDLEITLRKETRLVLGQQMQLSMKLLQMTSMELEVYLRELALENPLLKESPPKSRLDAPLRATATRSVSKPTTKDDGPKEFAPPTPQYETLADSVHEQIMALRIPELMRRELLYLEGEMDSRGYLPEDCGNISVFGGSWERYEYASKVFQSLEPPGVGARNLSECLCIQLDRRGCKSELAHKICTDYLDRLAKGQLNHISNELGAPIASVSDARDIISSLEPRPSNGFADGGDTPYVLPDIEITETETGFEVSTSDRYMPSYGVDAYYASMANSDDLSESEREYFADKLRQARWAINCVERRRDTLLTCAGSIVEAQHDFFLDGVSPMQPLTMTELADKLDVHPSTISRAVRGKYLLCRWGVYPLSHFFAQELAGSDGGTAQGALAIIKELIAAENPAKPLSDRELSELLAGRGFEVSRRTVAKYRDEALIPSAPGRRVR